MGFINATDDELAAARFGPASSGFALASSSPSPVMADAPPPPEPDRALPAAIPYDVAKARAAGLPNAQIADYLAKETGYDITAARRAGVHDWEIIDHLATAPPPPPPPPEDPGYLGQIKPALVEAATGGIDFAESMANPIRMQAMIHNTIAPIFGAKPIPDEMVPGGFSARQLNEALPASLNPDNTSAPTAGERAFREALSFGAMAAIPGAIEERLAQKAAELAPEAATRLAAIAKNFALGAASGAAGSEASEAVPDAWKPLVNNAVALATGMGLGAAERYYAKARAPIDPKATADTVMDTPTPTVEDAIAAGQADLAPTHDIEPMAREAARQGDEAAILAARDEATPALRQLETTHKQLKGKLEAWVPEEGGTNVVDSKFADLVSEFSEPLGAARQIYFRDRPDLPDGVFDENQPDTIFLSNRPSRAVAAIVAHETGHLLDNTKVVDGEGVSLGDLLREQIQQGATPDLWKELREEHKAELPLRENYASDEDHAAAEHKVLMSEAVALVHEDAPLFDTFFPKVVENIKAKFGDNVATEVVGNFLNGLRDLFSRMQRFFTGRDPSIDKLLTNYGNVIDTVAKIHAEMRFANAPEDVRAAAGLKAPEAAPAVAEPPRPVAVEPTPATEAAPAEGRPSPEPAPGYDRAKTAMQTYQRWLDELDTQRRQEAEASPQVSLLRRQEAAILDKVGGVEDRLTGKATDRLTKIRSDLDALLNPTEDNADMAQVRRAMLDEQQRMADAAAPAPKFSPKTTDEEQPVFFSALTRGVEGLKLDKATPGQWESTIRNMPGVKAAEIDWSGLRDWLGAQPKSVTKDEVLDYLRAHEVQVQEVLHSDELRPLTKPEKDERYDLELRYRDNPDSLSRDDYARLRYLTELGSSDGVQRTKFGSYVLPGGENYRELLLTLPEKDKITREPSTAPSGWGDTDGGTEGFVERGNTGADFRGAHFNEPNILAHIRFDDRTGPNGEKVMHVAEVQSDWHQKGRRQGYKTTPEELERLQNDASAARVDAETARAELIRDLTDGRFTTKSELLDEGDLALFKKVDHALRTDPRVLEPQAASDAATEAYVRARRGVPDAPFKTTWQELAMKRVLRYAAEHGYDRVTWDTGETQAARYDLSKQISNIYVSKLDNGKTNIRVTPKNSETFQLLANPDGKLETLHSSEFRGKTLADVLGKDMADKILAVQGKETISGDGLSIGGEGMRGFYDRILPQFVDKYTKKWGGKVEQAAIPQMSSTGTDFVVRDAAGEEIGRAPTRVAAVALAEQARGGVMRIETEHPREIQQPVHSLAITPTMRESVMKGQPLFSPKEITDPGKGVEDKNVHGFAPSLRVKVQGKVEFATNDKGEPVSLLTQTTTNNNAERQLNHLDTILTKHRDPTASPGAWSRMMAYALGNKEVPIPPYAFIRDLNSDGAAKKIAALTPGQISDANHGFEQSLRFREAYEAGRLTPVTTGKLFLWSFLSRGVSPYTQEGLFVDAFNGAAPWIQRAADGTFTKADVAAYKEWAATVAPKGSGQPGAGAAHNLNAFGDTFLTRMAARRPDGKTNLQYLHDMFSDPNMTGQQIRREFLKFGEGVGIDNKVVSFTLLVAGHHDVMVIDRVQTRQLWDDGRFAGRNIYDGEKNAEGQVVTGTPLANLTYGVRGLLAYEAIERGLRGRIEDIYTAAGRPQDASVGRYHWESWVAYSQQEASHGTLGAILDDATPGRNSPAIAGVTAKQGEFGAYEYGARYGRAADNNPYFEYATPGGRDYKFSVPAFRAFLEDIKRPATGVVPPKFKVTESGSGPWYDRPEVNQARLDAVAAKWADGGRSPLRGAGEGEDVAGRPAADTNGRAPAEEAAYSAKLTPEIKRAVNAGRRESGLPVKYPEVEPANDARPPRVYGSKTVEGTGPERQRALDESQTYNVVEDEQQRADAQRLIESDPERALAIALRQKPPPKGMLDTTMYVELRNKANREGDVDLKRRLAMSPVPQEATKLGQDISYLRNIERDDATDSMAEIYRARAARVDALVDKGMKATRAQALSTKRPSVNDFIMSIACGPDA